MYDSRPTGLNFVPNAKTLAEVMLQLTVALHVDSVETERFCLQMSF